MIFASLDKGGNQCELHRVLNVHRYDSVRGVVFTLMRKDGYTIMAYLDSIVWRFHTGSLAEFLTLIFGGVYRWKLPERCDKLKYFRCALPKFENGQSVTYNYPWTDRMIVDSINDLY